MAPQNGQAFIAPEQAMGDPDKGKLAQHKLECLHPDCWRWAVCLAKGDRDIAEDILHDAYLSVLENRAIWQQKSSYKSFVFGVIRMTAKAHRRRQALHVFRFTHNEAALHLVPASPSIEPLTQSTLNALNKLPVRQREIAELVFAQDLTIEEAATIMNISIGSARQHFARAKKKLQTLLTDQGKEATNA